MTEKLMYEVDVKKHEGSIMEEEEKKEEEQLGFFYWICIKTVNNFTTALLVPEIITNSW